ncbi:MAG: sulfatase [Verrucomicrobiales bacterium]|nr:sulfatase [Verrucomicrobiales bacterium]
MRAFHQWLGVLTFLTAGLLDAAPLAVAAPPATDRPNVVLIFCDDLGYGDLGCFGAKTIRTPHLDRLARQGMRFTDFYAAQPVCSASRAALLTGCYPNRVGITGALDHRAKHGLDPTEETIADLLRARGYATGMVGKWHLGHLPPFLPTRQGFDRWYGLPYSNDMWPYHPEAKAGTYPPLPLYDGDRIVDAEVSPADQDRLTTDYTRRAVAFIEENRHRPFFLYVAHSMPHVPLHVSSARRGASKAGLYGDVVAEIDQSVGEIMQALDRFGLDRQTLLLFTSDNGPWLSYGPHAGSAGPLREGKGTTWEGGIRVPMIARWPDRVPRGTVCREPAMTIDILPTLTRLTGASLPVRPIDGLDISPLLFAMPGASSPHRALWFYYHQNDLEAVRSGPWKLILPHSYATVNPQAPPARDGRPTKYASAKADLELYHLVDDVGETRNVAASHQQVVARLQLLAEEARADLGDTLTQRAPTRARPAGVATVIP